MLKKKKLSFDIIQLTFDGTNIGSVFGYPLVGPKQKFKLIYCVTYFLI